MIRQAETAKAKIYDVPGRLQYDSVGINEEQFAHSVFVDANYLLIGSHVDESTRQKIESCQYVDLARLLPRDKVDMLDDHRMVPVNENGQSFWVPFSDRQNQNVINSYPKWELAFRVYTDIFTRKFPMKAPELLQYTHVIHTIAQTYSWESVYRYDRDFREHMAHHPLRSWGIILQPAWNLRLNSGARSSSLASASTYDNSNSNNLQRRDRSKRDVCWRYNRGRCTYGSNCKFDHRCAICAKPGHGAHNCRKMNWDNNNKTSWTGGSGGNKGDKGQNKPLVKK